MWVFPFLYPSHAYPVTTFYQEWSAVALGLFASLWLLVPSSKREADVPQIIILPMGLTLIALLHLMQGKLAYPGQAQLLAEYFLWCALLMLLGFRLRQHFGLPHLLVGLAGFALLGAELNALFGIFQHYHWHTVFDRVVTSKISVAVYGNLAQPNHYANQLALGLISLGLLGSTRKLPSWFTVLLALPLLFVMVLSGSRSSWLYLGALPLLALSYRHRSPELRWLWRYSVLVLAGFALMHGVVQLPWLVTHEGITSFSRLYQESGGNSIRLFLWREALQIWADYPVFGAGFSQFAWQHFIRLPGLGNPAVNSLYNNAHNLPMQLAAETGLVGLLLVLGSLLTWLLRVRSNPASPSMWWGYGICAVLGLHSLLEYPLWYAYFLGIAAFVLGALEPQGYRLALPRVGQIVVAGLLLFGLSASALLLRNYRELEALTTLHAASLDDQTYVKREVAGLNALAGQPELRAYAELYLNPMYQVNEDHLDFKHPLNQRVMHAFPIGQVVYREVLFLAITGRMQEAEVMLERAIWSYPAEFAATRDTLEAMALKDPARYAALLKFALQKFEEHQRAVSAG